MRAKFSVAVILASALIATVLWSDTPKSQTVSVKSGDEMISGYLAEPSGGGRHPGIVAFHEYWGLTPWAKEQADKLAQQGYVVLAIDLYRGKVTDDPKEAAHLSSTLPKDRAYRDSEAAFDYLASRKNVDPKRIADIGWCMGGGYAIQLAIHESRLAACVVNYGALPTDPADIEKIKAPVLGNFGALDDNITPAKVHAFDDAMKADGKSVNVKIYDGAPHAFENPGNKDRYRPEATADAWKRIDAFYASTLH